MTVKVPLAGKQERRRRLDAVLRALKCRQPEEGMQQAPEPHAGAQYTTADPANIHCTPSTEAGIRVLRDTVPCRPEVAVA